MLVNDNVKPAVFTAENNKRLTLQPSNRGEPFREGVVVNIETEDDYFGAFFEVSEARRMHKFLGEYLINYPDIDKAYRTEVCLNYCKNVETRDLENRQMLAGEVDSDKAEKLKVLLKKIDDLGEKITNAVFDLTLPAVTNRLQFKGGDLGKDESGLGGMNKSSFLVFVKGVVAKELAET